MHRGVSAVEIPDKTRVGFFMGDDIGCDVNFIGRLNTTTLDSFCTSPTGPEGVGPVLVLRSLLLRLTCWTSPSLNGPVSNPDPRLRNMKGVDPFWAVSTAGYTCGL